MECGGKAPADFLIFGYSTPVKFQPKVRLWTRNTWIIPLSKVNETRFLTGSQIQKLVLVIFKTFIRCHCGLALLNVSIKPRNDTRKIQKKMYSSNKW